MSDALSAYALPIDVSEGVWITLDNADVKFKCKTPSEYNREYQTAYLGSLDIEVDENQAVRFSSASVLTHLSTQKRAFASTCIVECSDSSVILATLYDKYPQVVDELFEKATQEVDAETKAVEDTTKKS